MASSYVSKPHSCYYCMLIVMGVCHMKDLAAGSRCRMDISCKSGAGVLHSDHAAQSLNGACSTLPVELQWTSFACTIKDRINSRLQIIECCMMACGQYKPCLQQRFELLLTRQWLSAKISTSRCSHESMDICAFHKTLQFAEAPSCSLGALLHLHVYVRGPS